MIKPIDDSETKIPNSTWVFLYAELASYVLEYSSLDAVTEIDEETGDERYTEEKQEECCGICEEVEDIMARSGLVQAD